MSFCQFGNLCAVYDRSVDLSAFTGSRRFCDGCRDATISVLQKLRLDYVDLTQLLPKADARNEVGKIFRPKPESSLPMNLSAFTLRGEIAYVVVVAEKAVRQVLGEPGYHPGERFAMREGYALDAAVRYLQPRVDDLAGLAPAPRHWRQADVDPQALTGVEVVQMMHLLHSIARRMCGTEPRTLSVPGVCPSCQVPSLRRHDDNPERLWCVACNLSLSQEMYLRAQREVFARPSE